MGLVTATEVKVIMEGLNLTDPVIESYIAGADALINKVFAGDTELGPDLLKQIELWLTAHMIASTPSYRTAIREKVGEAETEYTGKYGSNLSATPYGQMVLVLDITGKLAQYVGKARASIFVIPSFD
jgi:hypothetical protein